MLGIVFVSIFVSCQEPTGNTTGTVITDSPSSTRSVQDVITNDTAVTRNTATSSSGKLYSAKYDSATDTYTLVYKIGRITDLFSAYVTQGQRAGAGNVLTYNTNTQSVTAASIDTTVSESISVGIEAGVEGWGVTLKSSIEATVGVSLSVTKTTEQAVGSGASYAFDLSSLDSSKKYAIAGFSSMDFYQVFIYKNGTATPIKEDGKPLVYYDILDLFSFDIYEYIPKNEIEYKTLEAWDAFTPDFSNADTVKLNSAANNGTSSPPPPLYSWSGRTAWVTIRTETYRITDSGRFNQPYDVIGFNRFNYEDNGTLKPINLSELKQLGYKTISFYINLNVKEVDDGNQCIFLYNSPSQSDTYNISQSASNIPSSSEELSFEHSPDKDTSWWVHDENELYFARVPIEKFIRSDFTIRYGAWGTLNDTWENKDLKIQLYFQK